MVSQDVRVNRGDLWWADFGESSGSAPGYRRPVVVLQSNFFNHSALNTVVVVSVTSNLGLANKPGNVLLSRRATGLSKDSVANVTQVGSIDKRYLLERCGRLDPDLLGRVAEGVKQVLDL